MISWMIVSGGDITMVNESSMIIGLYNDGDTRMVIVDDEIVDDASWSSMMASDA